MSEQVVKKKRGWPKGKPRKPKAIVETKALSFQMQKQEPEDSLSKFERFLNVVRGKSDVKSRIRLLLDPDKVETSTYLTKAEVDFIATSIFTAQEFPMFEPLASFSYDYGLTKISEQGHGVESVIRFTSAINESKLLSKFMFNASKTEETGKGKESKL